MKLRTRNEYDEVKAAVEALIAEASFVETHERTSEYEMLEKRALKTLAGRAMIEYQEGKCIPSDQAMLHFESLEAHHSGPDSVLISKQKGRKIEHFNN